jgi:hypothetical protein
MGYALWVVGYFTENCITFYFLIFTFYLVLFTFNFKL